MDKCLTQKVESTQATVITGSHYSKQPFAHFFFSELDLGSAFLRLIAGQGSPLLIIFRSGKLFKLRKLK